MRISASTCSHEKTLWSDHIVYSCEQSIRALYDAGFRTVDIDFHNYSQPGESMTKSDWREWCGRQRQTADTLGMVIAQAHAPFYPLREDNSEDPADRELLERSIEGAHLCGVGRMVFHPFNVYEDGWLSYKKSLAFNRKIFRAYAALCRPYGIHIAIENMIEPEKRARCYCSAPDELIELVDALDDPLFGVCWDFGHANLNGLDQVASLRKIGKRLIALHVDDNFGNVDDHIPPYFGKIKWEPILETLKEIEYDGDWTYEVITFFEGLPDAMQTLTLEYTYKLAEYTMSIASRKS